MPSKLSAGSQFPSGVVFQYAAPTESEDVCGSITSYNASDEFANKKVILISVPGAFTPACHQTHLPGYVNHVAELKKANVDAVVVIATNDAWVMEAWAKNRLKNVDTQGVSFLFMADDKSKFSREHATVMDGADRNGRYAMLIDHGKVVYAGYDTDEVKDSAFSALQSKL